MQIYIKYEPNANFPNIVANVGNMKSWGIRSDALKRYTALDSNYNY